MDDHGVKKAQIGMSDSVLEYMIENYTRESGVRSLEKIIESLCGTQLRISRCANATR